MTVIRATTLPLLALLGLALAGLGLAATLDLVSVRALFAHVEPRVLPALVEGLRAPLGHRSAQAAELAAGLCGLMLLSSAAWWTLRRWAAVKPAR